MAKTKRMVRVKGSSFMKRRGRARRRAIKRFVRRTVYNMAELKYKNDSYAIAHTNTSLAPNDAENWVNWLSIAQGDAVN